MRTRNSIDLMKCKKEQCWGDIGLGCNTNPDQGTCGTYLCPFYKPAKCKDWIRIEDDDGVNCIPPEEYYDARARRAY